jgi:SnoaL-like protein
MAGASRSLRDAPALPTRQALRNSRRTWRVRRAKGAAAQGNVEVVRRIFERWAEGDSATDWADADIDFCGPDLRAGRGVELMARLWGHWLGSMNECAVVPEQFLEAGEDEVLVPVRVACRRKASGATPEVRIGVSLFRLSAGKVVRLSFLTDTAPDLESTAPDLPKV